MLLNANDRALGEAGSALVMVLVAAAIGVIVVVSMVTFMSDMHKMQTGIKYRSDATNFNEEIRALLSSTRACTNSFGGRVVGPGATFSITTLFDDSPAPGMARYTLGSAYDDRLVIQSMTLDTYTAGSQPFTGQMVFRTNISVDKQTIGAQVVPRTVNVRVQFDAANTITSCIALAKMSDGIWQRTQANANNIVFVAPAVAPAGGNVGIGTSAPLAALDVAGEGSSATQLWVRTYSNAVSPNGTSGNFSGLGARGTQAAPLFPRVGDRLAGFRGANAVTRNSFAGMEIFATEDHSALAQGKAITFSTSANGTTAIQETMRIDQSGNVGIGVTTMGSRLEVSSEGFAMHGFTAKSSRNGIVGFTDNATMGAVIGRNNGADSKGLLGQGAWGVFCERGDCGGAGPWINTSDRRLKSRIRPIEDALSKILRLQGVTYHWRDSATDRKEGEKLGLVAQNVDEVFPQAVTTNNSAGQTLPGGTKMIAYSDLIAPIIQAIKELYFSLNGATARIAALEADNAALNARAAKVEKENVALMERLQRLESLSQPTR